ncbi:MAG: GrpB family protein [Bacteroidia bacterium]|nr:GrpB family protein [Bacteroidia bacterium]
MKITIVPYDPNWKSLFLQEKSLLEQVLQGYDPEIEHIGSTAIPGLAAKPVIDIMVRLAEGKSIDEGVPLLVRSGYTYIRTYEDEIPYRRFFVKVDPEKYPGQVPEIVQRDEPVSNEINETRTHQVHLLPYQNSWWERHLQFRDFLIRHPRYLNEYQELKARLSSQDWERPHDYAIAKGEFVKKIERLAREEAEG